MSLLLSCRLGKRKQSLAVPFRAESARSSALSGEVQLSGASAEQLVSPSEGNAALDVLWHGQPATAVCSNNVISLNSKHAASVLGFGSASLQVPLQEVLGCEAAAREACGGLCGSTAQQPTITVHTIRRRGCEWKQQSIVVRCATIAAAHAWCTAVNAAVSNLPDRPKRLLVFVNPYGGARKAEKIWAKLVHPIFKRAGIECTAVHTSHQGHAFSFVSTLSCDTLLGFDGVVAVGGDGLFQEIMRGLLHHRGEHGIAADVAAKIRLGHIPAGSTDAVTYTVNGTRCATAAALHIALGDRTPLDVMEINTRSGERTYAVCLASYGFMGDLMKRSERMRWMGPLRYDITGALMFLRGKSYRTRIRYLPAASSSGQNKQQRCHTCCARCEAQPRSAATVPQSRCARAADDSARNSATDIDGAALAAAASNNTDWRVWEGDVKSLMCAVTPCRSDKSKHGVMPHAHLADGCAHLVIVQNTSRFNFLRFLISLSRKGVDDSFSFVDCKAVTSFVVEPIGSESAWNVDGELLPDNHVSARVHCGLIDVFARGIEVGGSQSVLPSPPSAVSVHGSVVPLMPTPPKMI